MPGFKKKAKAGASIPPAEGADEDSRLWRAVTKSAKALPNRSFEARQLRAPVKAAKIDIKPTTEPITAPPMVPMADLGGAKKPASPQRHWLEQGDLAALDGRHAERLRRGKMAVARRIDLHGYSRDRAAVAVIDAILAAHQRGDRYLLVVTGKGQGILQQALPLWLNDGRIRPLVLGYERAIAQHGGDGAFYVALKRQRGPQ